MERFDVVILGAGAAGLMAGIEAGRRGRRVLVVDHAKAPGEKIRISGGGRCNFTNLNTGPQNFLSANPRFCISALRRYTPRDFLALVESHGIAWCEKAEGQLFCDGSARQVVDMLVTELRRVGAVLRMATAVESVQRSEEGFRLQLAGAEVAAGSVVVATGGKSIPKMGATGLAYDLARQFGLKVTPTRPGLVPLTFEAGLLDRLKDLAGVAVDAVVRCGKVSFSDPVLFTHRGLSGPAILQVSSYWREGEAIELDLAPGWDALQGLRTAKTQSGRTAPQTLLAEHMPRRLAQHLAEAAGAPERVADCPDAILKRLAESVNAWRVKPVGSEGYRTAEVTLGGVDTDGLDGRTMAARAVPGLYFVGEAVDVTGWLGGYNFQWAWASGWVAGQAA